MKTSNNIRVKALLTSLPILLCAIAAVSCGPTVPPEVDTVSLQDSVIAAAKAAKAGGAKTMTYEASVTTVAKGEVAIVVPVGVVAPGFGGSYQRTVGSKVTIVVDIAETAKKESSGQEYRLNTRTLQATPLH